MDCGVLVVCFYLYYRTNVLLVGWFPKNVMLGAITEVCLRENRWCECWLVNLNSIATSYTWLIYWCGDACIISVGQVFILGSLLLRDRMICLDVWYDG